MTTQDDFTELAIAFGRLGVSVNEAVEGIRKLQQALKNLPGPASDAKPENPNQKMDLEIFEEKATSRIEPINNWYEELLNQAGHYDHLKII